MSYWNRTRALPNYEVSLGYLFAKEYKNKLVTYSLGMVLGESSWNESLLKSVRIYTCYKPNMHELS